MLQESVKEYALLNISPRVDVTRVPFILGVVNLLGRLSIVVCRTQLLRRRMQQGRAERAPVVVRDQDQ